MPPDDQTLDSKLGEFLRREGRWMLPRIRRRVARWPFPPDAGDVLQEVYVAVVKAHRSSAFVLRSEAEGRAYLLGALRWVLARERDRRLSFRYGDPSRCPEQPISLDDPIAEAVTREQAQRTRDLLADLARQPWVQDLHHEILALRFHAGSTIPEIAEILGLSPNAVQLRLGRMIAWLRDRLEKGR